jgi:hypothetical protein
MTQAITEPGPRLARKLAEGLRERSVDEIRRRGDDGAVAEQIGLALPGLEALLWRTEWPLEQAVKVAGALGLIDDTSLDRLLRGQ